MKKNEIEVGGTYSAKVSDKLTKVKIESTNVLGGWDATNLATGKKVRIKSAQRLRRAVKKAGKAEATKEAKAKEHDPDRCATPRCRGTPAVVHLDKPLCQKCWTKHCDEERKAEDTAAGKPETAKPAKDATRAKRGDDGGKSDGKAKDKRLSALDAAAQVIEKAGKPMRAKELITAMAEQQLWCSPSGATPHATLYAAMTREIAAKGDAARFKKIERGQFAFNA